MVLIDYETGFVSEDFDYGFGIELKGNLVKPCTFAEKTLHFTDDTASLVCSEEDYDEAVRALHKYVLDNNYQIVGPVYKIIYGDKTVEIKLPIVALGEFNGHWKMLDYLPCKEMFHPKKRKSVISHDHVKELYFLPGGEWYWCFGWTKGVLLSNCGYPYRKSQNCYTIEQIDGKPYLFVEFKGYNYFEGGKPVVWVFEKLDSKAYSKTDIMRKDEIPQLPADDSAVLGAWQVCDLVRPIESFHPQAMCVYIPKEALYWRTVEFLPDGVIKNGFLHAESGEVVIDKDGIWRWMKGYVICNPRSTASMYQIRVVDGREYLFIQWKSGDYSYGGEEPFWYVFQRAE